MASTMKGRLPMRALLGLVTAAVRRQMGDSMQHAIRGKARAGAELEGEMRFLQSAARRFGKAFGAPKKGRARFWGGAVDIEYRE